MIPGCFQTQSSTNVGIKTNPLADEEVLAVHVGVEEVELLQGQPGGLRHGDAGLVFLHPVRLDAVQRHRWGCARQGDRDKETRDHKSGGPMVRHCNNCAREGGSLRSAL